MDLYRKLLFFATKKQKCANATSPNPGNHVQLTKRVRPVEENINQKRIIFTIPT